MNNLKEKYREAAEKRPILLSTLSYSGLALVIAGAAVIVFVFVLNAFGVYGNLETALDLKHNSVVILGPMLLLALLASLSLLGGVQESGGLFSKLFGKKEKENTNSAANGMDLLSALLAAK